MLGIMLGVFVLQGKRARYIIYTVLILTHSLTHSKRFIPVRVVDDPVTVSREYILVYPVLNPAF